MLNGKSLEVSRRLLEEVARCIRILGPSKTEPWLTESISKDVQRLADFVEAIPDERLDDAISHVRRVSFHADALLDLLERRRLVKAAKPDG